MNDHKKNWLKFALSLPADPVLQTGILKEITGMSLAKAAQFSEEIALTRKMAEKSLN